jgi:hypothetical protein
MVTKLMKREKNLKEFKYYRELYPSIAALYKKRSLSADVIQK